MCDKLNVKQEKFIQGIIKGLSQRQAYKEAYEVDYDDNAIDINASKLFNSAKVKLRYEELLQELQDKSIMTAKERMIWLSDVVKGNIKHISYGGNGEEYENEAYISDKLKAVDTLNKMSGEYTTKVDANVNTEIKVTIDD
ncbi:MAG: terminase small subunit [Clostridia bacterium]|nr:terminase small subunit [Clostridia bacterium]